MNEGSLAPDLQRALLAQGFERPVFERIRAGRNSRVWRVEDKGRVAALKEYFSRPDDPRDRMGTEFEFSSFLWANGVRNVAQPLARFPELAAGLYAWVEGERVERSSAERVEQAAAFMERLVALGRDAGADALPPASEACRSLNEHVAVVGRRLRRLGEVDRDGAPHEQCRAFVRDVLVPSLDRVRERLLASYDAAERARVLPQSKMVLSPSDFGFHNCLETNEGLVFLDFEYAGWDDPAKLVCDFACQPEIPVNEEEFLLFRDRLFPEEGGDAGRRKIALLLGLHRLKWCCIMLNEFLVAGRARRRHAGSDHEACLEQQLAKAKHYHTRHMEGY